MNYQERVQHGKVRGSSLNNIGNETKDGYIVSVSSKKGKEEYRLFKSITGYWSVDEDGKIGLNDYLDKIKDAIMRFENDSEKSSA